MTMALEGGEGSARRPSRSLPPGKIQYPLYRRLDGPQGRSGQVQKISPPTGIQSPDRPACSQSLYWLCYLTNISRVHDIKLLYIQLATAPPKEGIYIIFMHPFTASLAMTSTDNPSIYPFIYIMSWKEYYGHPVIGHNNSHLVTVTWQQCYLMNRCTYCDLMHTLDMKP
jgi:hypothetical protein